jgi:predicted transposase/invertase (TIGR01784 family)
MEKGITQGLEQGAYNKSLETAKKLLAMSLPLEKIAEATDLPLETVMKLKNMA